MVDDGWWMVFQTFSSFAAEHGLAQHSTPRRLLRVDGPNQDLYYRAGLNGKIVPQLYRGSR